MSRDCDDALTNLYQYLDSELEALSSSRIRTHLVDCPECAHSFEFEMRLKSVIKERLAEDVPDDFIARLRSALANEASAD